MRAQRYAYFGRKIKKRDFRSLWITRISAALRDTDISYSKFIWGLRKAQVMLNRKAISELAIWDPDAFNQLVEIAKAQI
jgi:large subunit ribosomal protein L20